MIVLMKVKKEQRNPLPLILGVVIGAPLISYLLTPSAVRLYCDINPADWCGLKMGVIIFGGISFGVFLFGSMMILIFTAPKRKK